MTDGNRGVEVARDTDATRNTDATGDPGALSLLAGVLALAVAGIHLYWGIPRFVAYASVGTMPDPRPLAFVLSGHAVAGALTVVALGVVAAERTYLPGIALMGVHLVGYTAWHTVLGHGIGASAVRDGHGHGHAADVVVVVGDHLLNSPLVLASKVLEVAVIGLLAVLWLRAFRREGRRSPGDGS